ncbi:FtsX-like permease family protein [Segetibacter sp. 3557_3]|uniref:ABC transporter permease n=1 Tax=Segetibacter sp. 3557_3 TaxID=2547429 RepID=UPI0010589AE0|nr:ABC transporter permease [Segetibacter sp. 3557_3]TDH25506.1 FtsX-like permease family protein [Segetibacter sp. 3557_3]
MKLSDTLSLSYRTVRSNKLRTGITVAIIAFGIMALIGIITAIQAMNQSIKESFSSLGANAFSIRYRDRNIRIGGNRSNVNQSKKGEKKQKASNVGKVISYEQAKLFKDNYRFPAIVGLQLGGPGSIQVKYESIETNPDVRITGGDENFLLINGFTLQTGRNFSSLDVQSGRNVCLLGQDVAKRLFPGKPETSVDKVIRVGNLPYRVIGLLKAKGTSAMMQQDKVIVTSHTNVRRLDNAAKSFTINIMVDDIQQLDPAIGEATGTFRGIRLLTATDNENFFIDRSDSIAEVMINLLGGISGSAGVIGLITLIGAAIGLMNIMLVAVTERTKEVGLIKALGGTRSSVRNQFLFESIIISLLGAVFGIVLGVLVGNLFSSLLGTGFVVPWAWVVTGIIICTVVGLAAGLWPAIKASKLDPIVALRYE